MAEASDLHAAAAAVSADLQAAGIRHAVSGSIALAAHGYVRGTADVDLLVVAPALRIPTVFEIVRRHGFEGEDRALIEGLRERKVAVLRRGPLAFEILVPAIPYHETLVDRAVWIDVAGRRVPCVSAEDLIVLKMVWSRPKDVSDVHALVAVRRGALDAAYVRRTLSSILPDRDSRLSDWDACVRRFGGPISDPPRGAR